MSRPVNVSDSLSFIPSGYDSSNSSYSGISSSYPVTNGYTNSSSNNYAYITCRTGSRAESHISYTFNVTGIPDGATITSVTCLVKSRVSSTNYLTASTIQLYTGATAKGRATSAASTTARAREITNTGTWTKAELANIQVRLTGTRGTSNTNSAAYLYFYGADLTIEYTISGTEYSVVATSSVQDVQVAPNEQWILSGEDAENIVFEGNIDDYEITDNDIDIKDSLVQHIESNSGELETVLGTYTLVSGGFSGQGASFFSGRVGQGANATTTTSNYYSSGNGTIAVFTYNLVFNNIPSNATITRLYCRVNGHCENTSQSSEYMCAALALGSNNSDLISNELNFKSVGTSNSTQTIEATTLPTVSQLSNLKLRCRLGYYGGAINGATCYLEYTLPGQNIYYTYTLTNVTTDHVILVQEGGVYIPPEEDPEDTYWPITISSINATTNPGTGTIRVVEGSNQTITITPEDPQLTIALDNGVDITSQLTGGVYNTYTVTSTAQGASHGFNLNSSTGYYVSTNAGVSRSASVARLNLDLESDALVTIQYINYAEANYDYGMFGKLDTTVATDGLTASSGGSSPSDSTSHYQLAMASNNQSPQTITYTVPMGEHYIDIKYGKDDASDSGNDNLQWKVLNIEATSAGGDYTYTLTNITSKHSLVFIFGDVTYYFVTSSTTSGARIFPDGQFVKLPGENYTLNIVPDNINSNITLIDNNTNVSSQLERETGVDKNNNPVVSYKYKLTNIQATHTITVQVGEQTIVLYYKDGTSWRTVNKAYKKINGSWVEQLDLTTVFSNNKFYRKG